MDNRLLINCSNYLCQNQALLLTLTKLVSTVEDYPKYKALVMHRRHPEITKEK